MTTTLVAIRRRVRRLIPALLVLFLTACATQKVDWAARIGNYTFDQAVLELGPPDKQAPLHDGTVVAEWLTARGYPATYSSFGYGYGGRRGLYGGPVFPGYPGSPDYFLRLTFAPDGQLKAWKTFAR